VFEALARLFDITAGLQARFDLDAAVRIGSGINTGLACVGNMGSEASPDYTALSDAVNLTFRLESVTKELGCDLALGRKTYELVSACAPAAELFQPHLRTLKGYPEPKPVYAAKQDALALLLPALRETVRQVLSRTMALPAPAETER
jgi:adenylate cyclase